uniref:Uncharacterized protein n=1 Tax=Cannabis sativa TaxID=3483 RepID=A0A803P5J9_CANSA
MDVATRRGNCTEKTDPMETGTTSTHAGDTGPGEPLRDYIIRLMTEGTKVKGLTEEGRLAAILGGLEPLGELWKDIEMFIVGLMGEFLGRAYGFIKLEEAIRHVDTVGQNKTNQSHTTTANTSIQTQKYHDNNSILVQNGKRSNNRNHQGNGKKGKLNNNSE